MAAKALKVWVIQYTKKQGARKENGKVALVATNSRAVAVEMEVKFLFDHAMTFDGTECRQVDERMAAVEWAGLTELAQDMANEFRRLDEEHERWTKERADKDEWLTWEELTARGSQDSGGPNFPLSQDEPFNKAYILMDAADGREFPAHGREIVALVSEYDSWADGLAAEIAAAIN